MGGHIGLIIMLSFKGTVSRCDSKILINDFRAKFKYSKKVIQAGIQKSIL